MGGHSLKCGHHALNSGGSDRAFGQLQEARWCVRSLGSNATDPFAVGTNRGAMRFRMRPATFLLIFSYAATGCVASDVRG